VSAPKLTPLLTFADVARLVGDTDADAVRRWRRRLLRDSNAPRFIVRVSSRGSGKRAHYRVALAPLQEYLPQLRDHHDATIAAARRAVSEAMTEVVERIDGVVQDLEALGAETGRRLRDGVVRMSAVEARVTELEKRGQGRLGF
jgi:hypothetical protein